MHPNRRIFTGSQLDLKFLDHKLLGEYQMIREKWNQGLHTFQCLLYISLRASN